MMNRMMRRCQQTGTVLLSALLISLSMTPTSWALWGWGKSSQSDILGDSSAEDVSEDALPRTRGFLWWKKPLDTPPPDPTAYETQCNPIREHIQRLYAHGPFLRTLYQPRIAFLKNRHCNCIAKYMTQEYNFLENVRLGDGLIELGPGGITIPKKGGAPDNAETPLIPPEMLQP